MRIKRKYYYLITSLTELNIQDKDLAFSAVEFRDEVKEMIDEEDLLLMNTLFYLKDMDNLLSLIKTDNTPLDPGGTYSKEELLHGMAVPDKLVPFMRAFITNTQPQWTKYSKKLLRKILTEYYIDWTRHLPNVYLKAWFEFEHNIKNIIAGLNCRKFNLDINEEVIGSHFEAEKIRRNREKDFGLERLIEYVDPVISHYENPDLAIREFALEEMRWYFAEELNQDYFFTIENLLTYAIQLQIIERSIRNNPKAGEASLEALFENIKKGYNIPEEFN